MMPAATRSIAAPAPAPAPLPVPPEFPSFRRLRRAKSVSRMWIVEPELLAGNRSLDLGSPPGLSGTTNGFQTRPQTSAGDGKEAGTTSSPPVLSIVTSCNEQPQSPPPKLESNVAQVARDGPSGTPLRFAQNSPVTPETTPQPFTIRPVNSPQCVPKEPGKHLLGDTPTRFWTEEEENMRWTDGAARIAAAADRVPAATKSKDAPRFSSMQVPSPPPTPPLTKVRSPGIFSILSKSRKSNATTISPTSSMRTLTDDSRPSSSLGTTISTTISPRTLIEPGGKGIVPQTDAPISASNGGERAVSVRCGGVTLDITVNSDTNALDILLDCSTRTTTPINIATSTTTEMYNQLGLSRRIRPYECVRDILNSWDRDSLNCLVVRPDTVGVNKDLDAEAIRKAGKKPNGFVLQLYHSQEPKKWNKRYITLVESGQMFSSKKPDPNLTDKDTLALCHLSDFDVYTPTESQTKQLRPPRRYCYAIKSQQKATVFVNSANFAHFFCTEDPQLADSFHSLVRGWRSWYLVSNLKEPEEPQPQEKEPERPPQIPLPVSREQKKTVSHVKVYGHKVKVSIDESPYPIGTFEPLLDLGRFDKPLDEFGKDWIPDPQTSTLLPEKRMATSTKPDGQPKLETDNSAFAAGALLGDGYEKLKQAQKDREKEDKQKGADATIDGPFTDGPSLLNGGPTTRTSPEPPTAGAGAGVTTKPPTRNEPAGWFPSALEHSARNRSTNSPQKPPRHGQDRGRHHRRRPANLPPPLVDLTPTSHEGAPQWSPHNHYNHHHQRQGRPVRVPRGTTLVDLATSNPTSQFPFPSSSTSTHTYRPSPPRNGNPVRMPKPGVLSPRFNQNPGRCPDFLPPPPPPPPFPLRTRTIPRGSKVPGRVGGPSPGMAAGSPLGREREGVPPPGRGRDPRMMEMRPPRGGQQGGMF